MIMVCRRYMCSIRTVGTMGKVQRPSERVLIDVWKSPYVIGGLGSVIRPMSGWSGLWFSRSTRHFSYFRWARAVFRHM